MKKIFDAVIFDFDGVILDSEPIHYEACIAILKNIGLELSYKEYVAQYIGLADKEMFPTLLNDKGYIFSPNDINVFINKKIETYTHIINHHQNLPVIPGVEQYIDSLREQSKKLGICSGSTRKEINTVLGKLQNSKLPSYFDTIVASEDVQCGKPSPESYLLTATRLQVSPAQCLVIEDTPAGIQAAKSAGMYVIALQTTHDASLLEKADRIEKNFLNLI